MIEFVPYTHPMLDGKPVLIGDTLRAHVDCDEGSLDVVFKVLSIVLDDGRWCLGGTDGEEYYSHEVIGRESSGSQSDS